MKTARILSFWIAITSIFAHCASQKAGLPDNRTVEQKLQEQKFVFVAQQATPTGGPMIQLNAYYDMRVSGDSLISGLPYFGRAFSAPMPGTDGGYAFTSADIDYQLTPRDKDGWTVEIKPNDRNRGERFVLTAFANGNATVQVTSNNRQPIRFSGRVK